MKRDAFYLALFAVAGFLGLLVLLLFVSPSDPTEKILTIMVGVLGTIVTQIYSFYFGSSSGSEAKNETIHAMLRKPGDPL